MSKGTAGAQTVKRGLRAPKDSQGDCGSPGAQRDCGSPMDLKRDCGSPGNTKGTACAQGFSKTARAQRCKGTAGAQGISEGLREPGCPGGLQEHTRTADLGVLDGACN